MPASMLGLLVRFVLEILSGELHSASRCQAIDRSGLTMGWRCRATIRQCRERRKTAVYDAMVECDTDNRMQDILM